MTRTKTHADEPQAPLMTASVNSASLAAIRRSFASFAPAWLSSDTTSEQGPELMFRALLALLVWFRSLVAAGKRIEDQVQEIKREEKRQGKPCYG